MIITSLLQHDTKLRIYVHLLQLTYSVLQACDSKKPSSGQSAYSVSGGVRQAIWSTRKGRSLAVSTRIVPLDSLDQYANERVAPLNVVVTEDSFALESGPATDTLKGPTRAEGNQLRQNEALVVGNARDW